MAKIGFIGLGTMGSNMAANLQAQGFELVVHTRTRSKADPLIEKGAVWADTPAELGKQAEVVFTIVSTPAAVRQVALGEAGFLDALEPGSLWVDCTTTHPGFAREMAAEAASREQRFMDAPVAGTRGPARDGTLIFIAGGEQADFEACQPYFDAMGSQSVLVGEAGMGVSLKVVLNMLLAINMLAFAEAMSLGEALGLEKERLFDVLLDSAVVPSFVKGKRGKMETGQYDADFMLKWMHKDLQMAAEAAYDSGASLPLENSAKEIYALAVRKGLGELDFSAIYRFITEETHSA